MIFRLLMVLLLLLAPGLRAAEVSGVVSSAGEKVPFAVVHAEGTSISATTDTNGYYQLKNLSAGTYVIRVQCINYLSRLCREYVLFSVCASLYSESIKRISPAA